MHADPARNPVRDFSFEPSKTSAMEQIAIQGIAGCYHESAARLFFAPQTIDVVPCPSFEQLFERLAADRALLGIAAIENTIAGSLLPNHELLRNSRLRIVGEQKLRISHVIAALRGQSLDAIREVHSHPIALMQCSEYLKRHPAMKVVERDDTAGSAREIARNRLPATAAICGADAAAMYGLEILQRGIETNPHNFTRFLVLADESRAAEFADPARTNKASLVFTLRHTCGSLSKVLTALSFYDINLTKIQSMPIIGREWEYRFYVDVTFDDPQRYRQAIEAARPLTSSFRILGEYAEGADPALQPNN